MLYESRLLAIFIALSSGIPAHAASLGPLGHSAESGELQKDNASINYSPQEIQINAPLNLRFYNSFDVSQALPYLGEGLNSLSGQTLNYGPEFFGVDSSCSLGFSQGCNKGPYFSILYIGSGSSMLPITNYESSATYKLYTEEGESVFNRASTTISIKSEYKVAVQSEPKAGGSIALGYDFGGFRSELLSTYSSFKQKLSVTGGTTQFSISESGGTSGKIPVGTYYSGDFLNTKPNDLQIDIDSYSLLLRSFIDIPTGSRFVPFLGFGLGGKYVNVGSASSKGWDVCTQANSYSDIDLFNPCPARFNIDGGSTIVFAGQVTAGTSFVLTKNLSLTSDVIYDYTSSGAAGDYKFSSNGYFTGSIGLRYKF